MKEKIQWLTILRSINIILVVMFHVMLIDMNTGENNEICSMMSYPFNPIRMPLFIFISGGLLYISRIDKGWKTAPLYRDKAIRILVPFIFFVTVYYIFKAAMNPWLLTPVEVSLSSFLRSFVIYNNSSTTLWFLATLMTLMLMYPMYVIACRNNYVMSLLLIIGIVAYPLDLTSLCEENYFNIANINKYFIYFYSGILFFRYSLNRYLDSVPSLLLSTAAYILSYRYSLDPLDSLAGIAAMVSLTLRLSRHIRLDLSFIGDNIYQIYLMSFIFQRIVGVVLWKRLFYNDHLFFLFYVLNLVLGVCGPLAVTYLVRRCPYRPVRMCFGLK